MEKTLGQINYEARFLGTGCWADWQREPESVRHKYEAAAKAVIAAFIALPKCDRCGGVGTTPRRIGVSYKTDSTEERALNWRDVKCKRCDGLGRQVPHV